MSELVEVAILAYRNGRYRDAIELLLQVASTDPDNWLAKLYLAMAYEKSGRTSDAYRMYKVVSAGSPDKELRATADNALPQIEAEMRLMFQKDVEKKKNGTDDGEDDIFQVGT
jgi:cytochrome c-type biogenesis protein CcmH/NrfG